MNKLRNFIKGTDFSISNNGNSAYSIIHDPSGAYVTIINYPTRVSISNGSTPNKARGKGIGTNLRALATLHAILTNKRIIQTGSNREGRSARRKAVNPNATLDPTSTWILRQRLGWRAVNKTISNFNPTNNKTKVKKWLINRKFKSVPF